MPAACLLASMPHSRKTTDGTHLFGLPGLSGLPGGEPGGVPGSWLPLLFPFPGPGFWPGAVLGGPLDVPPAVPSCGAASLAAWILFAERPIDELKLAPSASAAAPSPTPSIAISKLYSAALAPD